MEKEITRYAYISRSKKTTNCILHENYFTYSVQSARKHTPIYKVPYSDIVKIHLSKTDVGWYGIDICLKNSQRLHFKNLAFFRVENGEVRRIKITPEDNLFSRIQSNNYREFLLALHEQIYINQLSEKVTFTYGNTIFRLFILFAILVTGAVILPMALQFASIGKILFFIIAILLLVIFYFKIDFKRKYKIDEIPKTYLPCVRPTTV